MSGHVHCKNDTIPRKTRMIRKPPTMIDVARVAGVSPMTVSRAFKSEGAVSGATRAAILTAAEELGYVFDSTASNLRS